MGFKRVAWFGPYPLKQLGGIPAYKERLVDERHLNWGALTAHKPWMAVMDPKTRVLEFCGDKVDLYMMDKLLSPIIPEVEAARAVAVAEKRKQEAEAEEAAKIEKARLAEEAKAKEEAAKAKKLAREAEAAKAEENPTLDGEPKKKGRRKKKDGEDFNFNF